MESFRRVVGIINANTPIRQYAHEAIEQGWIVCTAAENVRCLQYLSKSLASLPSSLLHRVAIALISLIGTFEATIFDILLTFDFPQPTQSGFLMYWNVDIPPHTRRQPTTFQIDISFDKLQKIHIALNYFRIESYEQTIRYWNKIRQI